MRRSLSVTPCSLLLILSLALSGCETMQPMIDAGAAIGVSSGAITSEQADSLKRTTAVASKSFEDITPDQEYYIGRSVAATVLGKYRPYNNEEANHYINLLGQTLAQASDRPETYGGYHFLVLDSDEINAFAAPGGLILVTRGMLSLCRNEDELAAVLAHEIGHVQDQHGLKAIKTSRLTSAFTLLAAEGAKTLGGKELAELTEAFEGSVSDVAQTLMNSGYSREAERQADESAVIILKRVGYNPSALVSMLGAMEGRTKKGGPGFGKTHPDPEDRILAIKGMVGPVQVAQAPAARQKRFDRAIGTL